MLDIRWYERPGRLFPDLQFRESSASEWQTVPIIQWEFEIASAMRGSEADKVGRVAALIADRPPPDRVRRIDPPSDVLIESRWQRFAWKYLRLTSTRPKWNEAGLRAMPLIELIRVYQWLGMDLALLTMEPA